MAVRNPQIVSVGRHYGLTIATCVPADPESKGGSEATVRIAKAGLLPTEHNLRGEYAGFAELEPAYVELCTRGTGVPSDRARRRAGEIRWPLLGRKDGRRWEIRWPPAGKN